MYSNQSPINFNINKGIYWLLNKVIKFHQILTSTFRFFPFFLKRHFNLLENIYYCNKFIFENATMFKFGEFEGVITIFEFFSSDNQI